MGSSGHWGRRCGLPAGRLPCPAGAQASEGASRAATVFQRLVSAGKRLLRVIEHNEGGANKDLAKFADQINALCDKWDR